MADVKISELPTYPAGQTPAGSDVLPIVDTSGTPFITRKITFADLGLSTDLTVVQYASFLGSATGGANQTFSDVNFTKFATIGQSTIVIDGVTMTPNDNYSLTGAQLTIIDYMPPNAQVEVIYKVLPSTLAYNDIVLQNGTDNLGDQLNNDIITQ